MMDDEIKLSTIINKFLNRKIFISLFTISFSILGAIYSLTLPNLYKSVSVLSTQETQQSAISPQLSGYANIFGISAQSSTLSKVDLGIEVLKSKDFYKTFETNESFLVKAFAVIGWDEELGRDVIDEKIYDSKEKAWVRKVKNPFNPKPSNFELHKIFVNQIMNIEKDLSTGVVRLEILHRSPTVAAEINQIIIDSVNNIVRERDIAEADRSIEYLKSELNKARLDETKKVLSNIMEEKISKITLANSSPDYLFNIIDSPNVPMERNSPNRMLIVFSSLFFGFLLSLILVVFYDFYLTLRVNLTVDR